ncbi:MAG: hypothetical protein AB7D24_05680 [Sphaerochaeta sp.]|uniref:hypothetical protein n=1 Tax=Sphaerochaeta sp. TaxID=1972642 RepID=UPI003D0F154A
MPGWLVCRHSTFDGHPYDGSIVNMGLANADGGKRKSFYADGIGRDAEAGYRHVE